MVSTNGTLLRLAGAAFYLLTESDSVWEWWHYVAWTAIIVGLMELLNQIVMICGEMSVGRTIPARGKHLDRLQPIDLLFIVVSKLMTAVFTYHLARFCWTSRRAHVLFDGLVSAHAANQSIQTSQASTATVFAQQIVLLVALFVVYDFFYTVFHRVLHLRQFYAYVHKHHHRQKAPSRGQIDAVNVHPFEFFCGEYNHLFTLFLVSHYVAPVHALTVLAFILLGGVMASLNHTRFDVKFPLVDAVWQVKFHDIHHWYPKANFGQYSALWDYIFGWFKPYPADLRGVRHAATSPEFVQNREGPKQSTAVVNSKKD